MLSVVLLTPLLGFLVLLLIPGTREREVRLAANGFGLLGVLVFLPVLYGFQSGADFQFIERIPWIPSIGASYHLSVDGISLLMVGMTVLVGFLAILSSWNAIQHRAKEYYANFLVLKFDITGVFLSRDMILIF